MIIMDNRKIWTVFTCANLLLGFLLYFLIFPAEPIRITSTSAVLFGITILSLYCISYLLYKSKIKETGQLK
jgi:multidrug transporter EmrE-like cation transporter